MPASEKVSMSVGTLSWPQICAQHPNEWVCLLDVEYAQDGSIGAAYIVGHDRSMKQALDQIGVGHASAVVVHTSGRPMRFPRIEMTDEIRNIVRPRR